MKTVQESCIPRDAILQNNEQSYALNLSDLLKGTIQVEEFFSENFITEGMHQLIQVAFQRFNKTSETALIKLTQAMGGGKTHNMVVLGLLCQYPRYRSLLKEKKIEVHPTQEIRVLSFSGRESDAPHGIWGELARQLGKLNDFSEYYSPILKAPGETAWIRLLESPTPTLILLDELPPYYEGAKATPVGNSDLSVVTTTAIANLFAAIGKKELSNVLVVISDLKATYESGSEQLSQSLRNLDNESQRISLDLAPVRLNSDEIFSILRKKLFKEILNDANIIEVSQTFSKELKNAKEMELTIANPEDFQKHIQITYPFHPSIKDLYARFRENPGFQQTRGLIRLMRTLIVSLFSNERKNEPIYLLCPHHFDLNDSNTLSILYQINSSLNNSISKDIASQGNATAEDLDKSKRTTIFQETAKLIYFSSLSLVPNALRGLSESELVHYLVSPTTGINEIRQTVLPLLRTNCWYMHVDREGKYLFKETQNIVAKLNTLTSGYDSETPRREIEKQLKEMFKTINGDVYQTVTVFPDWKELEIKYEKTTLIIKEPFPGNNLPQDYLDFYSNQVYKNRILILTGERAGMDSLRTSAKNIKAIEHIIQEFKQEKIPETDLQFKDAIELKDQYYHNFYSATRETFNKLYYPTKDRLYDTDISMNFTENNFIAEEQIRKTLEQKQKFTLDIDSDTFRLKCEARLFTSQEMEWTEIKKRAAMQDVWSWHRPDALDRLKDRMIRQQIWRENGRFINKGPFPKPTTGIVLEEIYRNEDTGSVRLNLRATNGDTIYYDYGADPTEQSQKVIDLSSFETADLNVKFLCVDSKGEHPKGEIVHWKNKIKLKYQVTKQGNSSLITLKAIPSGKIRYTTDGSSPKEFGGNYESTFPITRKCRILSYAEKDGIVSDILSFDVDPEGKTDAHIDRDRPLIWNKRHDLNSTGEVYEFLQKLGSLHVEISKLRLRIQTQDQAKYIDLQTGEKLDFEPNEFIGLIDLHRTKVGGGENTVSLRIDKFFFPRGEDFLHLTSDLKLEYKAEEVSQS